VLGALLCLGLLAMGAQVEHTLLLALAINICTSIIIFKTIPEFLFRLVVVLVVRCIYKLRSQDIHCIPMQGRAMLVANHISWIDVLVIAATCPRPPVFVMHHSVAQWPVLGWFFRVVARAIPIAGKNENEALYHAAFLRIQAALENDELICIFPEGAISADGHIGPFKSGLFKALATTPAPVYAVGLSGLWHTAFSRQRKTIWKKLRSAWRSKTLQAHYATVPSHINTAEALQSHVQSLIKP
jgi:1-acyl-sn-glycerol-3-phosphate acyltransferase